MAFLVDVLMSHPNPDDPALAAEHARTVEALANARVIVADNVVAALLAPSGTAPLTVAAADLSPLAESVWIETRPPVDSPESATLPTAWGMLCQSMRIDAPEIVTAWSALVGERPLAPMERLCWCVEANVWVEDDHGPLLVLGATYLLDREGRLASAVQAHVPLGPRTQPTLADLATRELCARLLRPLLLSLGMANCANVELVPAVRRRQSGAGPAGGRRTHETAVVRPRRTPSRAAQAAAGKARL